MAKLETVVDSFDSTIGAVWADTLGATWDSGGTPAGQVALPLTTAYSHISTGQSGTFYDMTGSYIYGKVVIPPYGAGSRETYLEISRSGTAGATRDGVSIWSDGTTLYAFRKLAGATSGSTSGPYNATNHLWWKIRESGGTIYVDTSPDGTTWTNFWSTLSGFDVTSIWAWFNSGYWGTETAATTYIDQVNTLTTGGAAPTFPNKGIIDNFNRANQGSAGGGPGLSWAGSWGTNGWQVLSNQAVNLKGGWDGIFWNKATPADQEAYVTIAGLGAAGGLLQIWVRRDNVADTGYYLQLAPVAGANDQLSLFRRIASADVQLGATDASKEFAVGDSVGLQVAGSTLTVWYKPSAGSWAQVFTQTNTEITAANYVGLYSNVVGWIIDNYGGGDASAISTPISGTDSGSGSDAITAKKSVSPDSGVGSETYAITKIGADASAGSETSALAAKPNGADVGAGTEVGTPRFITSNTDIGVGAETVALVTQISAADASTGTEAITIIYAIPAADSGTSSEVGTPTSTTQKSDSDTGTGSEAITALTTTPLSVTDIGSGSDAATPVAQTTANDAGTDSEAVTSLVTQIPGADSGTGLESVASLVRLTTDSGAGSETGTPAFAPFTVADAGAGSEIATPTVPISSSDSGVGTEITTLATQFSSADTGVGVDDIAIIKQVTDSGIGSETAIFVMLMSDSGAGSDAWQFAAQISATDIGTGADFGDLGNALSNDAGVGTDQVTAKKSVDVDAGVGVEIPALARTFADSGTGADAATEVAAYSVADVGVSADAVTQRVIVASDTAIDSETVAVNVPISGTDVGTGNEVATLAPAPYVVTESGIGADVATLAAKSSAADTGSASAETATAGTFVTAAPDTGAGSDQITARKIADAESASGAEQVAAEKLVAPDVAVGTDVATPTAIISATDSGTATEVGMSAVPISATDGGSGADQTTTRKIVVPEIGASDDVPTLIQTYVAGASLVGAYAVRHLATVDLISTYRVRHLAAADMVVTFNVEMPAGANLTATYRVGSIRLTVDLVATYTVDGIIEEIHGVIHTSPRAVAVIEKPAVTYAIVRRRYDSRPTIKVDYRREIIHA
jgi:hypothetical protein